MQNRLVVLDTETTGLKVEDGHKVIQIYALELENRKHTNRSFSHYLNPGSVEIEQEALDVHGIDAEFLSDKPPFSAVADEFLEFITDAEIIIHNAPFDLGFLNNELQSAGRQQTVEDVCSEVTDTLLMARKLHPGGRNSLEALHGRYKDKIQANRLDRSVEGDHLPRYTKHNAEFDVRLLAELYLIMTGGQVGMFEEQAKSAGVKNESEDDATLGSLDGVSIYVRAADAEELADHVQILDGIKDSVWSHIKPAPK